MLGLSLAAQPEHETISVKRIEGTSFAIRLRGSYTIDAVTARITTGDCRGVEF